MVDNALCWVGVEVGSARVGKGEAEAERLRVMRPKARETIISNLFCRESSFSQRRPLQVNRGIRYKAWRCGENGARMIMHATKQAP